MIAAAFTRESLSWWRRDTQPVLADVAGHVVSLPASDERRATRAERSNNGGCRMSKRIAVFIAAVGLTIPLLGGVASAVGNHALSASPQHLDFGRVRPAQGIVTERVTITNESAERLGGGRYVLLGDVNLPSGFRIETRLSTCIASGGSLSGTTVPLGRNRSCDFTVEFEPTQLRSGEYTARLRATFGRNTIRVHASVHLSRRRG